MAAEFSGDRSGAPDDMMKILVGKIYMYFVIGSSMGTYPLFG